MNSLKVIFDFDTWQEIFGSIAKNKTRTIITVIGVLWGIFIYITLSGAAKGLDNGFEREFESDFNTYLTDRAAEACCSSLLG